MYLGSAAEARPASRTPKRVYREPAGQGEPGQGGEGAAAAGDHGEQPAADRQDARGPHEPTGPALFGTARRRTRAGVPAPARRPSPRPPRARPRRGPDRPGPGACRACRPPRRRPSRCPRTGTAAPGTPRARRARRCRRSGRRVGGHQRAGHPGRQERRVARPATGSERRSGRRPGAAADAARPGRPGSMSPTLIGEVGLNTRSMLRNRSGRPSSATSSPAPSGAPRPPPRRGRCVPAGAAGQPGHDGHRRTKPPTDPPDTDMPACGARARWAP